MRRLLSQRARRTRNRTTGEEVGSTHWTRSPWLARILVWGALLATVSLFGGRVWRVLVGGPASAHAAQAPMPEAVYAEENGALVELDRMDLLRAPEWMTRGDLLAALRAVRRKALQPRAGVPAGRLGLLDGDGIAALQEALSSQPWVEEARVTRRFPDRLALQLQVRRPVLTITDAFGDRWLLDRNARCLPASHGAGEDLPQVILRGRWLGGDVGDGTAGSVHPDPRARAALAVAREWQEVLVPRLSKLGVAAPQLVEVDPYNLDGYMLPPLYNPEIRVLVQRADGGVVSLAYGRPPGSGASRVPVDVKADVLAALLKEWPGLSGRTGADLRYANRWRDYVLPALGEDPFGRAKPADDGQARQGG